MKRKAVYPTKTSMNLFYKVDRSAKPATVALYILFALVCLLGLSKLLVYDVWVERREAEQGLAAARDELYAATAALQDYDEVRQNYLRYTPTDEERSLVDRMEVLAMLDSALAGTEWNTISIDGSQVSLQLSNVTLAETAEIVKRLEESPLVASTEVGTASSATGEAQAGIVVQLQTEEGSAK